MGAFAQSECNHLFTYISPRDGASPYARTFLPSLNTQQPYDVSLLLTVPVSESNLALGNFMASLTLNTRSNETIASSRRAVSPVINVFVRFNSLDVP